MNREEKTYTISDWVFKVLFFPWHILCGWWPVFCRRWLSVAGFAWIFLSSPLIQSNYAEWVKDRMAFVREAFLILWFVLSYATNDGKNIRKIRWRWWILLPAVSFCAYLVLEEMRQPKDLEYVGLIYGGMVLCGIIGGAGLASRKQLWNIFCSGVQWAFVITAAFCFLYRPIYDEYRYLGMYTNPNYLGMFMILVLCVEIYRIDRLEKMWRRTQNVFTLCRLLGNGILLGIAGTFLYLSQARTSLIAFFVMLVAWLFWSLCYASKIWKAIKSIFFVILLGVLTTGIVFPATYWGLKTIPYKYGSPLILEDDMYKPPSTEGISKWANQYLLSVSDRIIFSDLPIDSDENSTEAESSEEKKWWEDSFTLTRIFKDDWKTFGGRDIVWKGYLKELSWEGHEHFNLVIEGRDFPSAHNNLLQYGYTYGLLSMILYGILFMVIIVGIFLYPHLNVRKSKEGLLFFVFQAGFMIIALTEVQFIYIQNILVLPFWLSVGTLSVAVRDKEILRKKKKTKKTRQRLHRIYGDAERIKESGVEGNIDKYERE